LREVEVAFREVEATILELGQIKEVVNEVLHHLLRKYLLLQHFIDPIDALLEISKDPPIEGILYLRVLDQQPALVLMDSELLSHHLDLLFDFLRVQFHIISLLLELPL